MWSQNVTTFQTGDFDFSFNNLDIYTLICTVPALWVGRECGEPASHPAQTVLKASSPER